VKLLITKHERYFYIRFDINRNLLPLKKSEAIKIQECLEKNHLYKKIILKEMVPASMWWINMGKNKNTGKFFPTHAEHLRICGAKEYLMKTFNGFVDIPNSHRKSHGNMYIVIYICSIFDVDFSFHYISENYKTIKFVLEEHVIAIEDYQHLHYFFDDDHYVEAINEKV